MPRSLKKIIAQLQKYSGRWWYLPLMAFLIFLDLFVVVIPSEAVLVKTILLKPSRWWYAPLIMITASALGAVALAALTQQYGVTFVNWISEGLLQSEGWATTEKYIQENGAIAMALISLSPFPQQPAVVACGLAHMDLWTLALAVFLGRAPKYFFFGWIAKHSPKLFARFFQGQVKELETPEETPQSSEPTRPSSSWADSSK